MVNIFGKYIIPSAFFAKVTKISMKYRIDMPPYAKSYDIDFRHAYTDFKGFKGRKWLNTITI